MYGVVQMSYAYLAIYIEQQQQRNKEVAQPVIEYKAMMDVKKKKV